MKARWLFSKVSNEKGHALAIAQALLLALKLMMSASEDKPHEAQVLTQLSHVHLRENMGTGLLSRSGSLNMKTHTIYN